MLLKSCWKLSKHTRVFWQILYELTFYYTKSPDLLTWKSCGRLILKYSQTKPKWSIAYELELMSKGIKPIPSDCWQHLLSSMGTKNCINNWCHLTNCPYLQKYQWHRDIWYLIWKLSINHFDHFINILLLESTIFQFFKKMKAIQMFTSLIIRRAAETI